MSARGTNAPARMPAAGSTDGSWSASFLRGRESGELRKVGLAGVPGPFTSVSSTVCDTRACSASCGTGVGDFG